jgi:uncharacterized protein
MNKVLLIFIIGLLVIPSVISQVEIKDFVNDYAGIIDPGTKAQLDDSLKQIYDSGVAQYSIVTIKSLEGKDIESYSLNLAQSHLGSTQTNNGLLLLVAVDDRQYRFEVGRGIEDILNDAKVGRIGRTYLVPNFKAGNYSNGILEASLAVKSILLNDSSSAYYVSDQETSNYSEIVFYLIFFLFFFGLPIFINYLRWKKTHKDKYFNAAAAAIILFGGRGGSGGSGGSSGGFGGFGGGGFGGGGASGGW